MQGRHGPISALARAAALNSPASKSETLPIRLLAVGRPASLPLRASAFRLPPLRPQAISFIVAQPNGNGCQGNCRPGADNECWGYGSRNWDAPSGGGGLSNEFVSAQQTITAGGALTLAHGLGAQPKLYAAFLQCTTAELGYSIGDEVAINPGVSLSNTTLDRGLSIVPDATNINVRFGSQAASIGIIRKDTGGSTPATNASWRLVVRAWA